LDQIKCSHLQFHAVSQKCIGKPRAVHLAVVINIFKDSIE
jgi:hypothetical protein